jgi:Outer membrane protein beta-barrel domain
MKKYLLSATLLIAVCISAKAQFSLGIKGGVNFSKIDADNVKESSLTGYQAGLFARFGNTFYIQPEAYLNSTGGKFDFSSTNTTTSESGKVTFTNLTVPVLLGHSFGSKDLNFRLMVGPEYTYALSKNQTFDDNVNGALQDFGRYKNSTIGFQAGGGVDIGPITADIRYQGGLTKINSNFGQTQNLWALSVGFKFF